MSNYYDRELERLVCDEYGIKVVFSGANGSTRTMNINRESAQSIVNYLTKNYLTGDSKCVQQ